ncbi:MAG TPA: MarR family transcriptional regulator [Kofleriaceae bacterium]|nr:MarR family transcriptional regulator [Kofleriaceae bacterium]
MRPVPGARLSTADYRSLADFRYQLRRFLAFSEEQARVVGLNPQQHQLLLAVRAAPEAPTIGTLAERLILRHHSVVGLLDRLEQRGLVRRERSPDDRRQARVRITPAGARVLHRLALAHRAELRRTRPQLVDALQKLSGARPRAPSSRRPTGAT